MLCLETFGKMLNYSRIRKLRSKLFAPESNNIYYFFFYEKQFSLLITFSLVRKYAHIIPAEFSMKKDSKAVIRRNENTFFFNY